MLSLPPTVRVFVAVAPLDMRGSFDALAGAVRRLGLDPLDGHLYLFLNKRRRLAKALWFDGSGWCVLAKRLEAGSFQLRPELAAEGGAFLAAMYVAEHDALVPLLATTLSAALSGSYWNTATREAVLAYVRAITGDVARLPELVAVRISVWQSSSMSSPRIVLSLAVAALVWTGPAQAGPWCVERLDIAPRSGHVLPPQPELLLFRERARYGGELLPESPRLVVRVTIDGKATPVALRHERTAGYDLAYIKVKSKRRGALVVRAVLKCRAPRGKAVDDGDFPSCSSDALTVGYTIADSPPPSSTEVGPVEARFSERIGLRRNDNYFFFGLPVRLPALWFEVRWRRDAAAKWSSFVAPAYPVQGQYGKELPTPNVDEEPGPAEVRIGEQRCHAPNIPLQLLQRGIEVEVAAKLTDGRTVPLTGVPPRLIYPETPMTQARDHRRKPTEKKSDTSQEGVAPQTGR